MVHTKTKEAEDTKKKKQADSGKDENTKAADKAHELENAKDPSEKDGQTTKDVTIEKEKPTIVPNAEAVYHEEPTKEQKIINYISGAKNEKVDLVPLLKSLYPMASHNEPAMYHHQGEAKRLRVLLEKMVAEGKLTMLDEGYDKLGRNFYQGDDPKTKFHTLDSVKIIAVK